MEIVLLFVGLVVGALVGFLAARALAPRRGDSPDLTPVVRELEVRAATAETRALSLEDALSRSDQQYRELVEQNRRDQAAREQRQAEESKVLETLAPVAKKIDDMERKVTEIEQGRAQQHGELKEQIVATQRAATESHRAASELRTALRGSSQVRGRWGEMALANLLESAGLRKGVDYDEQTASVNEDARCIRPDFVVHYPGAKVIALDAKVPLVAYTGALEEGTPPEEQLRLLAEHARAVKAHVNQLSDKKYWTGLDGTTLDFTVAFIPAEPILDAALKADPALLDYAFARNVVLATPASTWTILKSIAFAWRQEALTNEARDLFDLGKELYGRIVTMAQHVDAMGRTLGNTVGNYNKFVASLQRNVLTSAQRFERLDESKVFPALPELDAAPEPLTKAELVAALDPESDEAG